MMCCSAPKEHAIDLWSSRAQAKSIAARGGCGGPRAARGIQSAANRTTRVVALAVRVCCDSAGGRGLSALLLPFFLPLASYRSFLRTPFLPRPLGGRFPASSLQHLGGGQAGRLPPSRKANHG